MSTENEAELMSDEVVDRLLGTGKLAEDTEKIFPTMLKNETLIS